MNKSRYLSIFRLIVVLTITMLLVGCGGGGDSSDESEPANVDVTGSWSGSWYSSGGINTGGISLILTQSGSTVSGQATFTNSPCISESNVSGNIAGNIFTGSFTEGNIQFSVKITITDNLMNSTYSTNNTNLVGICVGYTGSFTAYRQ
jgi:hypothetical protein